MRRSERCAPPSRHQKRKENEKKNKRKEHGKKSRGNGQKTRGSTDRNRQANSEVVVTSFGFGVHAVSAVITALKDTF